MKLTKAQKAGAHKQAVMLATVSVVLRNRDDIPADIAAPEELSRISETIDRVANWLIEQSRAGKDGS